MPDLGQYISGSEYIKLKIGSYRYICAAIHLRQEILNAGTVTWNTSLIYGFLQARYNRRVFSAGISSRDVDKKPNILANSDAQIDLGNGYTHYYRAYNYYHPVTHELTNFARGFRLTLEVAGVPYTLLEAWGYTGYSEYEVDVPYLFFVGDDYNDCVLGASGIPIILGCSEYPGYTASNQYLPAALFDTSLGHQYNEQDVSYNFQNHPSANFNDKIADATDPYGDGGNSDEDPGGNGTFDDTSDTISDSSLPTVSMTDTGFTRVFNPTLAELKSLAQYLWTDQTWWQTVINQIKQYFENPMESLIALNLVPCQIPDGGQAEFKVLMFGTGVYLTVAGNQFIDVDCGSYRIKEYYGSALDYSPYTKVSLFLPYIGMVHLDTDDVMNWYISVKYRIDIVSGGCVAKVFVGDSVHYQFSGHCAVTIPFTSADFTGYISAMIQTARAVGSITAGAMGASELAATLAGMPEQRTGESSTTETFSRPDSSGTMMPLLQRTKETRSSGTKASFGSIVANNFSNTVGAVMGAKTNIEKANSFSGVTGYLGVRRPFLYIERPNMCNPKKYSKFNGRPCMMNLKLGDCSGFTQVQQVQLTGFSATNPELDELGGLLKSGVIL